VEAAGRNPELTANQSAALTDEIWNVGAFLHEGLTTFPNLRTRDFFFDLPFLLLQQGFERFMKLILVLASLEQERVVPEIPRTHDLNRLREDVEGRLRELAPASQFTEEWIRLDEDDVLVNLIDIASLYGSGGRYHVLDQLVGEARDLSKDPEARFVTFEIGLMEAHGVVFQTENHQMFMSAKTEVYDVMIKSLNRFARTLGRAVVESPLASRAGYLAPAIQHLLDLQDDE
jgi:hypothetical protein